MRKLSAAITILLVLTLARVCPAKVEGFCSNCHTMHSSQAGESMARGDAPWGGGTPLDTSPIQELLVASCLGCHSTTDSSALKPMDDGTKIPIVFNTSGYPSPSLAGGNFYFVSLGGATNDPKGHNIFAPDTYHQDVAPGDDGRACGSDSCHNNLSDVYTGTPAELQKQACEGCHLNPSHHADDHGHLQGGKVDTAAQGWYRFLSGHDTGEGLGAEGYEDGDWQHTSSSSDHNEYRGEVNDGGAGFVDCGPTTTAFCTGCHPVFHSDQGGIASPFLRHPSDLIIPNSGEYATAFNLQYDPFVPVARPSVPSAPDPNVDPGTDMVMCLSCHRAHGSPYDALLRWDYKNTTLSVAFYGCGQCHTSKK